MAFQRTSFKFQLLFDNCATEKPTKVLADSVVVGRTRMEVAEDILAVMARLTARSVVAVAALFALIQKADEV